jgi:RimJ/RimL family protein N-acetyltransferase
VRASLVEDASTPKQPDIDLRPVIEKATGAVIGDCGLLEKDVDGKREIELVYVFAPDVWGRGYATEMAGAVKRYAFTELGLERLIALIDPENASSERVAVRIGMRYERETLRPGGKLMKVYVASKDEDAWAVGAGELFPRDGEGGQ